MPIHIHAPSDAPSHTLIGNRRKPCSATSSRSPTIFPFKFDSLRCGRSVTPIASSLSPHTHPLNHNHPTPNVSERGLTIQSGIFTAGRRIYIPTIRTCQFHCVHPGHIGAAARNDMGGLTEHAGTDAEMGHFVFIRLHVSCERAYKVEYRIQAEGDQAVKKYRRGAGCDMVAQSRD